ncbi:MAG: hypothetical protein EOO40_07895 [Deltaproteobacteria bacterium]|nr:MAG: hypothetical protein EOO40_07895 [Deltaproteobacteria bacterium]
MPTMRPPHGSAALTLAGVESTTVPSAAPRLPPQHKTWPTSSYSCLVGAVAAQGVLPLAGAAGLAPWAGMGGAVLATAVAARGVRQDRRQEVRDLLAEGLYRLMGLPAPARRRVRCWRWRGLFVGHPHRLRLDYAPIVDDADPMWLPSILDKIESRMGAAYRVIVHDVARCRLVLGLQSGADEEVEVWRQEHTRATKLTALCGPVCWRCGS